MQPITERADEDIELMAPGFVTQPSGQPRERFRAHRDPGRPLSEMLREDLF